MCLNLVYLMWFHSPKLHFFSIDQHVVNSSKPTHQFPFSLCNTLSMSVASLFNWGLLQSSSGGGNFICMCSALLSICWVGYVLTNCLTDCISGTFMPPLSTSPFNPFKGDESNPPPPPPGPSYPGGRFLLVKCWCSPTCPAISENLLEVEFCISCCILASNTALTNQS